MALHGALRGPGALGGADDLGDVGRGPPGDLSFERLGQVQQSLLGHRFARSRHGSERLETAGAIGADPTVDRPAGHADSAPGRPGVVMAGQLAHEPAALARR